MILGKNNGRRVRDSSWIETGCPSPSPYGRNGLFLLEREGRVYLVNSARGRKETIGSVASVGCGSGYISDGGQ